jgi:hypothetical protein
MLTRSRIKKKILTASRKRATPVLLLRPTTAMFTAAAATRFTWTWPPAAGSPRRG